MSFEAPFSRTPRTLAGATVLQAAPALANDRSGREVLDLCIALLRSGARTMVVSRGGALVGELQALGGEWLDFDLLGASPLKRRRMLQDLRELILGERVDLVHAHGAEVARMIASAVGKQKRVAFVTTELSLRGKAGWFGSDIAAGRGLAIVPSEYAAALVAQQHRIARERIVVIPRPVDTDLFDPDRVDPGRIWALRKAWRIGPDERVVLAPGRLAEDQGYLELIEAVRMLVTGGMRRTVFVIAADGESNSEFARELNRRIALQGLTRVMRRIGRCDDLAAAYAMADLVVAVPERTRAFATAVAEAQAMARPVIASNVGALAELIERRPASAHEPAGWLVEAGETVQLARTLAQALATDRTAWQEMGNRARYAAEVTFARPRVAAATLAVYAGLLQAEASAVA